MFFVLFFFVTLFVYFILFYLHMKTGFSEHRRYGRISAKTG